MLAVAPKDNLARTFPSRVAVVIDPSRGSAMVQSIFDELADRAENTASGRTDQAGLNVVGGQSLVEPSAGMGGQIDVGIRPCHPCIGAVGGGDAGSKRGLEEIAAGRRVPIEHFTGDEDPGELAQHEVAVDLLERHAARRRDRPRDSGGAGETDRDRPDQAGGIRRRQAAAEPDAVARRSLADEIDRGGRKLRSLFVHGHLLILLEDFAADIVAMA
jgi:hypothetical protein